MPHANMDRRNEAAPQVLPLSTYGVVLASFTSKVASQNKGNLARLRKTCRIRVAGERLGNYLSDQFS